MIKKIKKWILLLFFFTFLFSSWLAYDFYLKFYAKNINIGQEDYELFIQSGTNFEQLVHQLQRDKKIAHIERFVWLAEKMNYKQHVKSGRYLIAPNLSNRDFLLKLRNGTQAPIRLVLNKFRTKEQLAAFVAAKIEADSASIAALLYDSNFLKNYDLTTENVMSVFLHNTYEFYWDTDAARFFKRMNNEYHKFWNAERKQKAKAIGLQPIEIITLASIVDEETHVNHEKPLIARVYLNRLKKNMKLQADPTVRFALQDFSIKRIKLDHLKVASPYNTYQNNGLPPGPICTPEPSSIEAVLSPQKHNYLFFCAKEDFSGTHNFASTHAEHIKNAEKYRNALNQRSKSDADYML